MLVIVSILISAVAVFVTGYILPGIHIDTPLTALVAAVVLGFINAFIRPILFVLTLPINVLTLGLFTFVIMALMVMLTSWIVPGFHVDGFWWALAFALVFAIINGFLVSSTRSYY
jgi:putative membrane protein